METATLAGGCFWCTEAIFKRLKGVISVTSGYAGGKISDPSYEHISTGKTGHAEAIQIQFDPKIISFDKLLDIFWVVHDPTTLNKQGPDVGTQYRSVIFYHDENQKRKAEESKRKLQKSGILNEKVVTEIKPFTGFFTAEEYHQNYYEINKNSNPYCLLVIDPKIEKLLIKFNQEVKEEYK
ncbi:peptide-methionine (S)-S-oxide reductase MsrA [Candidatus Daviesbacteria bacterium]|nr:peptide-methionine (S)-S-oxide reductase MsrA [Candidatus Daviesbacteria bacterium]